MLIDYKYFINSANALSAFDLSGLDQLVTQEATARIEQLHLFCEDCY